MHRLHSIALAQGQSAETYPFIFQFFQKPAFYILLLLILVQVSLPAQNRVVQDKMDPAFRSVINAAKERTVGNGNMSNTPHYSIAPTEGFALKGKRVEKRYECIVYTKNVKALRDSGIVVNTDMGNFATAWATLDQLVQMSAMPGVSYVEAPQISNPHNDISVGESGASLLHQGKLNNTVYKGKNVIVAIYDTGIDWDHLDFRDPTDTSKSRILRIWDQTITATEGEAPPTDFSYGVEYTQTQINDELDGTPANKVRERDYFGHGTHVAGTAAGNGSAMNSKKYMGIAPEADIVVIKGSDFSFNNARIIDGLNYLKKLAATLGKPIVVNMSLGGQYGPHDGTVNVEVAIDSFSAVPGRVVVISAGNDNNTNIHNSMFVGANGTGSSSVMVSDSTAADVFQYDLFANDSSDVTATVTAPDGTTVTAIAGTVNSARVLSDSFIVSLINVIDAGSKNRYVRVFLYRNGVNLRRPPGVWTLSITNNTTNTLTMHGWLSYKNPAFAGTSLIGGNSDYMVGSPGNATRAITTAAYIGKNNWYSNLQPGPFTFFASRIDSISTFSSRGPRRDGLLKPEIAADGESVLSCLSSDAAANFGSYQIAEKGLYVQNRGTSMAAPGVTGAVALLLQAKPGAPYSEIKGYITAAGNKDAMTELNGASPNPTWGYGKLDVFKAASLLFNCGPSNRKIYKYDSSVINAQGTGFTLTFHKIAVRFTPDISGKLGAVYFHPISSVANLVVEVRTNISGFPGALLGTVNLDTTNISKYALNHVNLSNLNISVNSGTDYYIVMSRAATSVASWSMWGERLSLDPGRDIISFDGGITWSPSTIDYTIRTEVYNNGQLAGNIASATSTDTRSINSSNQFINNNCQVISQVVPGGNNPVSGMVSGKVWLENSVPHFGINPYVQRHYEITPVSNANTGTGRVTLYFTQAEFTAFNNDAGSVANLPANPNDAVGKSNLRIGKYTGKSNDDSGLPGSYASPSTVIDPADGDIAWNSAASRWEVSFDVTGFSGFVVQSIDIALPIILEYFKGNTKNAANVLNWKINCTSGSAVFIVERSTDGSNFTSIGSLSSTSGNCALPITFEDNTPVPGNDYYRIRITESTGTVTYSNTILLQHGGEIVTRLFPTMIAEGTAVQVTLGTSKGTLNVFDVLGKHVYSRSLSNGTQSLNLGLKGNNTYFFNIRDDKKVLASGKIIVR